MLLFDYLKVKTEFYKCFLEFSLHMLLESFLGRLMKLTRYFGCQSSKSWYFIVCFIPFKFLLELKISGTLKMYIFHLSFN